MSINIGDNFSYLGKKFLDNRQSFDTLELMNNCSDAPLGFITYCKEDNKRYEYSDAGWIEYKSSITDEEAEKLNIAYLHSQTTHVQASDLEGFATEEFVTNKIAEAELGSEEVDLSGYVSKEELEGKGYLTGIPEEYVTDEELNSKGYLTEHQDLSNYATKEYVDDAISNIDISGGGNVDIDLSNYVTNDKLQEGLANKFDNVEVNEAETNDSQTALDFYANGEVVKTVYFSGGGGGSTIIPPYISTILPENSILGLGGTFNLQLDFSSSVTGRGTAKIFVNDVESISMSIPQGENTIPMVDTYFTKGNNRVTVYVIDRTGQMSNSLTFYVRYGSLEITSDFDAYTAYEPGAVVRYYFTPTAVDTSLALTMYMKIDGGVKDGVSCSSDTRGYFTFPNNLEVGAHFCQAYVMDSAGNTSNVLSFNFIILDAVSLVVASDTINPIVEEGEQLSIDYKVYMRGATSFITKTYIDENLVNTGTCGLDFAYYRTNTLTEGIHTIKMEVYDVTETVSDYIIWTVTVTPSTYEMLQPVKAGSLFIGTAQNMTNSSENKEVWRGTDQDGAIVDGILHNFAFNSESGWVDDELLISGASSVEIPITPLANNARYGFTLDIEFASKMIGVDDALVLNLWDDEKDCGIKITTEQVILRSAEGNQADLYFTDSEMTSVMFIIDRNEATAKIYLNGVMCSAFHLSDYSIDGVPYLEDFTVNNTIMLGGSGHARIKNLRVYQVALSTDEILNNFMANETRKAEQKALVEFQKGDHLPTLTIYCDFSGLGKNDKKPCAITYVSTDEEKYGKSFTLTHKKSTCQYQGTSSMAYPIKNYRINLADEKGEKWKYDFPYGQPERRYTLKADFMSSGHWTNTGLTKWINKNLYNYDLDDEKTMNPKKWYDINNGGSINDTRECIYGFPCRLILVNDGNTPLNEGQNEPTPGNTKDMGIFNFNHDKDATDTMGFDDDVFPNCASYEVTANSDTSAGAFMRYKGVPGNFATGGICETPIGYVSGAYYTPLFPVEMFDGVTTVHHVIWTACSIGVDVNFNEVTNIQGQDPDLSEVIVEGVKYVRFKYYNTPDTTIGNVTIKATEVLEEAMPNFMADFYVKSESDELDYIKQSFELRFPDEDDVAEGWGFMGIPGEEGTGLKALIDWVDGCTDEEFVRDFDQHFNRDYTLRYFLLVITLGMVDNLGKNMMLDTWDNKIFMPRFYDCDTICSYDNSGQLKFDVDIEMAQGYWNTSSSRLWTRIRDLMHDELVAKYNNMRQNGMSYESFMECFYDEQIAKIPQKYYNMDYDVKYGPFADSYIGMANGDTYEHLKRWLQQRLRFVDTLYDYAPSYNNDVLTIRANTTEPMTLEIETYTPVYQHLSWYNNQMDKKKIDGKTSVSFTGTAMAATDQEVLIYGGSNIKSIKGISSMNPNRMLIGSATRLIELDAPNCPLLADINANKANLAPHIYLNKVDLSGCPLLGGNLIVNQSPLVREIDIRGTAITGLNLPPSLRNLEVLKLPAAISNLVLNDAGQLHTLELEEGGMLQSVSMTNCNALTNVTNFNLEDATSITLNNSYNTVDELYFSKATNLSVSNMANLERVIYTPNAEHEVFDKANVDNASNYTISTFNCPKLNEFVTTAPYRESYNIYKDEKVIDTTKTFDILPKDYIKGYIHYETGEAVEQSDSPNIAFIQYVEVTEGLSYALEGECDTVRIAFYDDTKKFVKYIDTSTPNTFAVPTGVSYVRAMFVNYKTPVEQYKILGYGFTTIQVKDYGEKKPNEVFEANILDISSTQFTDVKLLCTTDTNKLLLPRTVKNLIVDSAYDLDTELLTDGDYDTIHTDLYEPYNTDYEENVFKTVTTNYPDFFGTEAPITANKYIDNNGNISDANSWFSTVDFYDISHCTSIRVNSSKGSTRIFFYDSSQTFIIYYDMTVGTDIDIPNNAKYARWLLNQGYEKRDITIGSNSPVNIVPSASDGSLIFSMHAPHNTTEPASGVWDLKGFEFDTFHTFGLNNDIKQIYGYVEKSIVLEGTNLNWEFSYGSRDHTYILNNGFKSITPLLCNGHIIVCRDKDGNVVANYKFVDKGIAVKIPANTYEIELECYTTETSIVSYNVVYEELEPIQIQMPNRLDGYTNRVDNFVSPYEVARYIASDTTTIPSFNSEFRYHTIVSSTDDGYEYVITADDLDNLPTSMVFKNLTGLKSVKYLKTDALTSMNAMFYGCSKLESINLSNSNTANVTSMYTMFQGCTSLSDVNLSGVNTSKVTSFFRMFYGCSSLTSLDLSSLDAGKVTDVEEMFCSCSKLEDLILFGGQPKLYRMKGVFNKCNKLKSLDLNYWDTRDVNSTENLFNSCYALTTLNISNWNMSKVTTMYSMFNGCSSLTSIDLSGWVTSSLTSMYNIFRQCSSLTNIEGIETLDTSKVANMVAVFYGCSSLTSLDLSGWDTSTITDAADMFTKCTSLQELHIETWPLNDVTQREVSSLPVGNDAKNIVYATAYFTVPSGWTLDHALEIIRYTTSKSGTKPDLGMFTAYSLGETDNGDGTYTVQIAANSLDNLPDTILMNYTRVDGLLSVDKCNCSNLLSTESMFMNCSTLTRVNLIGLDAGTVTNMSKMFYGCGNLKTIEGIGTWNTSNVTNMASMFRGCELLTSLDVSNWGTSKVADMGGLFADCRKLTSVEGIGEWDTSSVTAMNGLFSNCKGLTSLDLSGWKPEKVVKMSGMFYGCSSLSSVIGMDSWYCPLVDDISSLFQGTDKMTTIDIHTWKKGLAEEAKIITIFSFANNYGTTYIDISGIEVVDDINFANAFRWGLQTLKWSNWKNTIDLSNVGTLTQECVIDLVANLAEVTSTKTLTLGSTLLRYLTDEQIAEATNKGWTLV